MDRLRRVMRLWDWLPTFRAVAETEHLTQASHQLHVSPPAVSRTLKVLEDELGQPLFGREGRGLQLNPAGARLLGAVRIAMRVVHEAVEQLEGAVDVDLTIASAGVFTVAGLGDTVRRLAESHPHVRPRIRTASLADPAAELQQGHVDLVFTSAPQFRDGLRTVPLVRLTTGVYCGPSHPLYGRTQATLEEIVAHPFVAPPARPDGVPADGWPGEWPRRIAVEADRQRVGIDLLSHVPLLAVLPDRMDRGSPELWRLPIEFPWTTSIFAIHRETVTAPGTVEAAVEHARHALAPRSVPTS